MQVLNLDDIAPAVLKTVKLAGKEYEVREMSVADFIAASREAEALRGKETTFAEDLEQWCKFINRVIPDLSVETLQALGASKVLRIVDFVMAEVKSQGENPEQPAQAEGADPKS